jgi:ABC-type glutathione transport system ATPase component
MVAAISPPRDGSLVSEKSRAIQNSPSAETRTLAIRWSSVYVRLDQPQAKRGRIVVTGITHNLGIVSDVADRVAVMQLPKTDVSWRDVKVSAENIYSVAVALLAEIMP